MATQKDRGVPLSTLSPKFLHTNSTSHTWPFSAIAELIDNAYDPDVSAKQFWIDKTVVKGELCLTFMDNGNGLDHQTMHKMLSFGYSDKIAVNGLEPIGIYGNGFKSGSMRLGKDALVFSKSRCTSCVGMLSQTYLEKIDAKQIIVPIVCFEETGSNKFHVREEHQASLNDILQYSPFRSKQELLAEINAISLSWSEKTETGTRIIIWNLRRTSTGTPEFDFGKDRYDIRIPSEVYEMMNNPSALSDRTTSYIPESIYSLRAYCSILYLKPRMQVIIRGQKVKSQLIAKSLAYIRKDHYKPTFLNKRIPIIFGYNTKSKDQYGIMMYHKNRLIKAYERVGCQIKANNRGVGVIGVIECNFLDPTHNKQSFNETDKYRKTITSLGIKLEEYWNEIRYRKTKENPNSTIPVEDTMKRPDQNWVQCDDCLHWRKLPDGIDCSKLPDKWFCRMNPDPQFRSCKVEEEPEDSDDDQPSYRKTYKLQEKEDQKNREKQRQLDIKHEEKQCFASLEKQNLALRWQQDSLTRQLQQNSPSTPATQRGNSVKGGAPKVSSPAGCSGLPVIMSVCSLSHNSDSRGKRSKPVTPQSTPKRPRVNGLQQGTSNTPTAGSVSSPSILTDSNDDDDDTDDDIFILETESTPKPQKPALDVIVKKEEAESENSISMLLECSDDAAVDNPTEMSSAASTTAETGPPPALVTATTQTEGRKVKKEEESQTLTQGKVNATTSKTGESGTEKSSDVNTCSLEEREIKQESSRSSQSKDQEQALQNGVVHMESDQRAGPACAGSHAPLPYPSINEVQKQQDQLVELMQQTAQERDLFKDQVKKLETQLQKMQEELQESHQVNVKKESSHQACQTDKSDVKDYKSLFEKAKQKVNDLIKDKEALLSATESNANLSSAPDEEEEINKMSWQVGCLVEKLNERNKERDELRLQLDSLEEEKSNLAAQCEELRLSLQQQRENAQSSKRTIDFSVQTHPEEPGGSANSSSVASRSLLELRQNVGRLLVSYLPDLDLDLQQVNFECNVIDEILDQVLSNRDSK